MNNYSNIRHSCVIHFEKLVCWIIGLYLDKCCVKSFGKTQLFSWNTRLSLCVIWNNLLKDFQYLSLVKSCHPILTVGTIAVSNPRMQLVTDAWIGLLIQSAKDSDIFTIADSVTTTLYINVSFGYRKCRSFGLSDVLSSRSFPIVCNGEVLVRHGVNSILELMIKMELNLINLQLGFATKNPTTSTYYKHANIEKHLAPY